jgi:transposase
LCCLQGTPTISAVAPAIHPDATDGATTKNLVVWSEERPKLSGVGSMMVACSTLGWISWARRCRIPAFTRLAKTIEHFRALILNVVEHGLSNARTEATNTHLRLLTRRAYGYHSPESLIAMADLTRGGLRPPLPGRS